MGLFDLAIDALKGVPDTLNARSRIELALETAKLFETKNEELQRRVGALETELEKEKAEHAKDKEELESLRVRHAEEIRIEKAIEFRRGLRTGGKWLPFCPRCHLPASTYPMGSECSDKDCKWHGDVGEPAIAGIVARLA